MVREEVLAALEQRRGDYISGEALAEQLGVSRAAVWKTIDRLRTEGLCIDAVPGSGYQLRASDDSLTEAAVRTGLRTEALGRGLLVLQEADSTNTLLKRTYPTAPHGFTVIAGQQTAGRGRLGRSFISPPGGGLYMSMLLRPNLPLSHLNFLTITAAVAVCHAVEETCGFTPGIKWVNDIFMEGRKLCGILTEASIEGETGSVDFAVLGIGINLRLDRDKLPPEVREVAGCLADFCDTPPRRATLASAILNHVEDGYKLLCTEGAGALIGQYRSLLCMLGRLVRVTGPHGSYAAETLDIDENGHLLVRTEDGETRTLSTGEVSIRL
ncbi:MAG: biotin--[acetyl-CoA-carboxylase] ligase [Intestinibacillus sp.]